MTPATCFYRLTRAGPVRVRAGRPGDGPATYAVLHAAVHQGAAGRYTARERQAWSPSPEAPEGWELTLLNGACLIAQRPGGTVLGFMTLGDDGFVDLAYVAPKAMGKGVSDLLYRQLERSARRQGLPVLSTEASHMARGFFARRGWQLDARQDVIRNGVALTNFRMSKILNS